MDPVRLGGVAPPSTSTSTSTSTGSRATLDAISLRPSNSTATRGTDIDAVLPSAERNVDTVEATTTTEPLTPVSAAAAALGPDTTAKTRIAATRIPMAEASGAPHAPASQTQQHQPQQKQQEQDQAQPNSQSSDTTHTADTINSALANRQDLDSQESTMTSSSSDVFTPAASDVSNSGAPLSTNDDGLSGETDRNSQLHQLSILAATQDRLATDGLAGSSLKRTADGEVKRSASPTKGHARTTSAISVASTTGSRLGELSAELKTRLSYAMVKVNNGWQSHSIDEVETLVSRAASPSSTSTIHRRPSSSASPRQPLSAQSVHFAADVRVHSPKSNSPPNRLTSKPTLAPPAPIQPSTSMAAPHSNPRRNSNPRYTPTLLSHSHSASASPHTPVQPHRVNTVQSSSQPDPILFSPHQNEREQDAIESLIFMRTPNNSTNMKQTYSPSQSPRSQVPMQAKTGARHALPSGPRKALPTQRQQPPQKKIGLSAAPGSPMDVDSPQNAYLSPHRAVQRRQTVGATSHLRGALSLPSGLGLGNGATRKVLRDDDIERMLDRAEEDDSSDDGEIQLPRSRAGTMSSAMEV